MLLQEPSDPNEPKRGRGRPRKDESPSRRSRRIEGSLSVEGEKRGRGRPRKHSATSGNADQSTSLSESPVVDSVAQVS